MKKSRNVTTFVITSFDTTFSLTRMGTIVFGCKVLYTSLLRFLKIRTTRSTFTLPVVEPAQAPVKITKQMESNAMPCHAVRSETENPVEVMADTVRNRIVDTSYPIS